MCWVKKTNRRIIAGLVFFVSGVVLLEGNGYLIHHDLYQYGLTWSPIWADKDLLIKVALYQFLIFMLLLYHKSWRLFTITEVFWLSSAQDLLFYLVWGGGIFPSGDWTWMPNYCFFGHWTTADQVIWSVSLVCTSAVMTRLIRRRLLHV